MAVADPDLQIRRRGGGGGGGLKPNPGKWGGGGGGGGGDHPDPEIRGGGCLNFFFLPFEPQFGLKIRRGGTGPPGALPWIRH